MIKKLFILIILLQVLTFALYAEETPSDEQALSWVVVPGPFYNPNLGIGIQILPMVMYPVNKSDSVSPPSVTGGFLLLAKPDSEIDDVSVMGAVSQRFYLAEDTWRLRFYGAGARMIARFYNTGNTGSDNIQVWAKNVGFFAGAQAEKRVWKDLFTGLGYDFQVYEMAGYDAKAQLFMDLIGVPRGYQYNSTISANGTWDTRDSQFGSLSGIYANLVGTYADTWLGSSTTFGKIIADYSQYMTFEDEQKHILAWKFMTQTGLGDVPENQLSTIGGRGGLRGYMTGEYKDKSSLEGQVEYRYQMTNRLGWATFFGLGTTYGKTSFSEGPWLPSGGVGIRLGVIPEQRVNARLDFAWGRDSFSIYFGLGEAF